jgi:cellulose synthase/poly-beta-1,6-N-acetylglucosamine synthase-like glycosyltransferase
MLFWSYIVLISVAGLIQLLSILRGLYYLRVKFPRKIRPSFRDKFEALETSAPPVLIFVPCKGVSPEFEENINAMLRQDYPDYKFFFITESETDPAASLLSSITSKNKRARHLIAGQAIRCCQKNHNLLKGIDYVRQKKIEGEIYVFADMDICPKGDWLTNITLPLIDQSVFAVSGFRSLVPRSNRFAEHLHSAFNTFQCLAMTENRYAAMWGGSMALHRKSFEKYAVYEKWSTAMVDDMSLTSIIKKYNLKRIFSPDCLVDSAETYLQLSRVLDWIIRQTQFAAVYLRPYTTLGLCLNTILLLGMLMAPVALALAFLGTASWATAGYHIIFYILIAASISVLSSFRNQKKYELRWLLYAPYLLIFGMYCGWIGLFSKRLVWANIVYHVNQRGDVLRVER